VSGLVISATSKRVPTEIPKRVRLRLQVCHVCKFRRVPSTIPRYVTSNGRMQVAITRERLDAGALIEAAKAGADGAVCAFDGIVRDNTRGRRTLHLDYEAYEEMALEQMRGLAAEAVGRFGVRNVVLMHRLGRLVVGETSVLIVVASAHRGAAFDACRWLIDTLKKTVPIWKREQFEDGAVWADGEPFPEAILPVDMTTGSLDR